MRLPEWHAHVDVWVILGSVVAAYLIACRGREARRWMFLGGAAVLWVASDWPVHDLSEDYLYLMHMVQHMLFTLIAAPLLVAGVPAWLWRRMLAPAPARAVFGFFVRPVVAVVVFNGVLLFSHWPAVVTSSVTSEIVHFSVHALVVASAVVMWWPVLSPLSEMPALAPPAQMLYLFAQSIAPTIPASFLTFGHSPLYEVYATFPRIWGISAMTDQLVAGLIMKLGGGAILWTVIAVIFFRWAARERHLTYPETYPEPSR
jgi:putative membrane protein